MKKDEKKTDVKLTVQNVMVSMKAKTKQVPTRPEAKDKVKKDD